MELKDTIAIIISSTTLVVVLIQFFIKRKDEKNNYILNKKYELYTNFISDFNFDSIVKDMGQVISNIMKDDSIKHKNESGKKLAEIKFKEDSDFTKTVIHWTNSLGVVQAKFVDVEKFKLLSSNELIKEIVKFSIFWYKLQEVFKMDVHEYDNAENFIKYFDRLKGIDTMFSIKPEQMFHVIIKLMRKELGVI